MERLRGMDLSELMEHEGRFATTDIRLILRNILQGVADLHSKGLIHKDLKAENVMVDKPCTRSPKTPAQKAARALEFGKSPKPQERPSTTCTVRSNLDGTTPGKRGRNAQREWGFADLQRKSSPASSDGAGADWTVKLIDFDTLCPHKPRHKAKYVVGTDQYIAPEAYAGYFSSASDIFSVGVIAYKLFSLRYPFKEQMFDDDAADNWCGSPKMMQISDRIKQFQVNFEIHPWLTETQARDLTKWMLESEADARPTAAQCLQHPFFGQRGDSSVGLDMASGQKAKKVEGGTPAESKQGSKSTVNAPEKPEQEDRAASKSTATPATTPPERVDQDEPSPSPESTPNHGESQLD